MGNLIDHMLRGHCEVWRRMLRDVNAEGENNNMNFITRHFTNTPGFSTDMSPREATAKRAEIGMMQRET